jgi:Right handed beta helix region
LGSYGRGRATIASGPGQSGLTALNVGGLKVSGLRFEGADPAAGGSGLAFVNLRPRTLRDIHLAGLEISGYTNSVLMLTGEIPAKYRRVSLERLDVHDNAAGPTLIGHNTQPAQSVGGDYAFGRVHVVGVRSYGNTGAGLSGGYGGGIVLMNVDRARIESNRVYDNGGDAPEEGEDFGASGIIVYDGRRVTIERNRVWGQRYTPLENETDNAGIDMWATHSTVQYNHVHDNEGWGMILGGSADPRTGWLNRHNTIRYNLFADNGRPLPGHGVSGPYEGATFLIFGAVRDFEIHNNTLRSDAPEGIGKGHPRQGMIWMVDVPGHRWSGLRFRNNVLIARDDVTFLEIGGAAPSRDIVLRRNAYLGGAPTAQVKWGAASYDSVDAWAAATGQEGGAPIVDPAARGVCADGGESPRHYLPRGRTLVDRGLDLRRLGLEAGGRDLLGVPIPLGDGFDIGALERAPRTGCPPA